MKGIKSWSGIVSVGVSPSPLHGDWSRWRLHVQRVGPMSGPVLPNAKGVGGSGGTRPVGHSNRDSASRAGCSLSLTRIATAGSKIATAGWLSWPNPSGCSKDAVRNRFTRPGRGPRPVHQSVRPPDPLPGSHRRRVRTHHRAERDPAPSFFRMNDTVFL